MRDLNAERRHLAVVSRWWAQYANEPSATTLRHCAAAIDEMLDELDALRARIGDES